MFNRGNIVYLISDDLRENPLTFSHYDLSGGVNSVFETGLVVCYGTKTKRSRKIIKQILRVDEITL